MIDRGRGGWAIDGLCWGTVVELKICETQKLRPRKRRVKGTRDWLLQEQNQRSATRSASALLRKEDEREVWQTAWQVEPERSSVTNTLSRPLL